MPSHEEYYDCPDGRIEDCCTGIQESCLSFSSTQSSMQLSRTQLGESEDEVIMQMSPVRDARHLEMEELEQRLDDMMRERVQHALELQRLREGFNERAPMLDYNFLPSATKSLKFMGIAYWSFFVVRFLCLADLNLLVCLLGSISLICLTFAFATEQHLFFWPFAFVCILETLNATIQFISLSLLIYHSKGEIVKFMNGIMEHEDLFGMSMLDEMTTWRGVVLVECYAMAKLFIFPFAFLVCSQVSRLFHEKDDILQAQELTMDMHHQRMLVVMQHLDSLRRPPPNTTANQNSQPAVPVPIRIAADSRSMPAMSSQRFNARSHPSVNHPATA